MCLTRASEREGGLRTASDQKSKQLDVAFFLVPVVFLLEFFEVVFLSLLLLLSVASSSLAFFALEDDFLAADFFGFLVSFCS